MNFHPGSSIMDSREKYWSMKLGIIANERAVCRTFSYLTSISSRRPPLRGPQVEVGPSISTGVKMINRTLINAIKEYSVALRLLTTTELTPKIICQHFKADSLYTWR